MEGVQVLIKRQCALGINQVDNKARLLGARPVGRTRTKDGMVASYRVPESNTLEFRWWVRHTPYLNIVAPGTGYRHN